MVSNAKFTGKRRRRIEMTDTTNDRENTRPEVSEDTAQSACNALLDVFVSTSIVQNGIEYHSVGNGCWFKKYRDGKTFQYHKCRYCDRLISNSGRASFNHYEMHKRGGDVS
jgi:hypothetical protein